LGEAVFDAAGSEHTTVVSKNFKAFSWGFNVDFQAAQKDDDVECAKLIDQSGHKRPKANLGGGWWAM
jgi:hypothetical protein